MTATETEPLARTELDLDLGGPAVINARVKVEPYQPLDPFLRKLR